MVGWWVGWSRSFIVAKRPDGSRWNLERGPKEHCIRWRSTPLTNRGDATLLKCLIICRTLTDYVHVVLPSLDMTYRTLELCRPIIGGAKCIVAHPTKMLGGPWPPGPRCSATHAVQGQGQGHVTNQPQQRCNSATVEIITILGTLLN